MAAVTCPICSHSLELPEAAAGNSVRCPRCEQAFTLPSAAVASGDPPAKSANPDGAVSEKTPTAKTRSDWDHHDIADRRDIAKKSFLGVPIVIVSLVAAAGLCGCAVPTIFFLGVLPVVRQEAPQLPRAHRTDKLDKLDLIHPSFVKGSTDAKDAIAQNKLLLKEYPPLPAPGWHGEYIKNLKDRCNCDYVVIGEAKLPKDQVEEIHGWNDAMEAELRRRHGETILVDLNTDAANRWRDWIKAQEKKK